MASGAVNSSLTAEIVIQAIAGGARERLSAAVLTDSATGSATWRSQVFMLRARTNGFMVMLPSGQEIKDVFHAYAVGPGEEVAVVSTVNVSFETARGRFQGDAEVLIADLPWSYLPLFRKFGRSNLPLTSFRFETAVGRPILESALDVAEHWVMSMLDVDTANEYLSAAEGEVEDVPPDGVFEVGSPSNPVDPDAEDQISALKDRIAMLEGLVKVQAGKGPAAAHDRGHQSTLFDQSAKRKQLTEAELDRLHKAVGPAPRRLGRAESALPQVDRSRNHMEEALMAEADRGVIDLDTETQVLEQQVLAQLAQSSDPLQRLMVLQMRQTQDLVKALVPKSQADPIAAMLSGSDNGAASSSSGVSVKGYAAREMFLRQLQDDRKLVDQVKMNARTELGIPQGREEPALLRQFLEQRIPIGDHKTMAQFGYMLAWGWEIGETSQNHQLMAFCGRMMMFVEQSCLDSGRTGLAWLMTGLPEPNFQQLALNKKRSTLTPFAKLAPPTWIAANLSYLKDVDMFDTRLRQLGVRKSQNLPSAEADAEDRSQKPKFKPRKPKGGKGAKGSEAVSGSSTA